MQLIRYTKGCRMFISISTPNVSNGERVRVCVRE